MRSSQRQIYGQTDFRWINRPKLSIYITESLVFHKHQPNYIHMSAFVVYKYLFRSFRDKHNQFGLLSILIGISIVCLFIRSFVCLYVSCYHTTRRVGNSSATKKYTKTKKKKSKPNTNRITIPN